MRVGLVGTGYWGSNHLRALRALQEAGQVQGIVVCDVDEARARTAAKEVGCDFVTSPEALFKDARLDAVDIVTPTPTHFDLAKRALEAGKHVLVEKPMTQRLDEARELVQVAERAGKVLMPGHLFRYHPGVQWVHDALQRRELGAVLYMSAARQAFREPRPDMGVLHALGIHELDLFCWLQGREWPDTVQCTFAGWHQEGIEEVAWMTLRFGDVVAHAAESWASPWAGKERHLAVFGTRAAARVDFMDLRQVQVHDYAYEQAGQGWTLHNEGARTLPVTYKEPLMAELEDFLRCARTGARPLADMGAGLRGVAMLEACFQSAREGRAVAPRA